MNTKSYKKLFEDSLKNYYKLKNQKKKGYY